MTVSPDLPRSAEQTPPPPKLLIDFGCDPRVGVNLQLKFCVVCPGFASKPLVTVRLDRRLDQQDWKSVPQISQEDQANWTFDEPLRTTSEGKDCRPGTYSLEVRMVFHEGAGEPVCFRGRLGISVPDPAQPQAGPTLEIEGAEKAAVNLMGRDLSEFSKVVVKVGADGVANIQEKLYPDTGTPARSKNCVADLQLKRDRELERQLPRAAPCSPAEPRDAAALLLADGHRILLLARSPVLLGRERRDSQGRQTNDITLRLWSRASKLYDALERLVSRTHLLMMLGPDGLQIHDKSTWGSFAGGQQVASRVVLGGSGPRAQSLAVAGVLGLEITCHRDPVWAIWHEWTDLLEQQYYRAAGVAGSPLWPDARGAGLDAVRIRRSRRLPIGEHLKLLGRCLSPNKFEAMRRTAQNIDPLDELAGREQYVLVFRTATVGGSEEDPICLRGSGLSAAHARIFHLRGRFWLENLADDQQVAVAGRPLPPHELAPLVPGTELAFGYTRAVFGEFEQAEP